MIRRILSALVWPAPRYDFRAGDLGFALGLVGSGLMLWLLPDSLFTALYYHYLYPSAAVADLCGGAMVAVGLVLLLPRDVWPPPWPGVHTLCAILSGGAAFTLGLAGFGGAMASAVPPVLSWFLLCVGLSRLCAAVARPWSALLRQVRLEALAAHRGGGDGV